jgi:hypothetical protein
MTLVSLLQADWARLTAWMQPAAVVPPAVEPAAAPVSEPNAPVIAPSLIAAAGAQPAAPALRAPTITPKQDKKDRSGVVHPGLARAVKDEYAAATADGLTFTTANMRQYFGVLDNGRLAQSRTVTKAAFERYIVTEDPVTGGPITFLGRPIRGGVNAYMLPMLKAAEADIIASGLEYTPQAKVVLGYGFRGMRIGGKESTTILSSHSAGLSIDLDAGSNGAHYDGGASNRGNIPDEVVLTMIRYGFVWGGVGRKGFEELGDDPMHFQQSLHPDDTRYQRILGDNATAKAYFDALQAADKLAPLPPKAGSV